MKTPYAERTLFDPARLWKGSRPLLTRLDIELTERCNNNCIHCNINRPRDDSRARAAELDTGDIAAVLTEAAALGCLAVRFTGGEPLLREDFAELYLYARKSGLRVLLFTNATLIGPELAALLRRIPPLEPVEITLYGMTPESYEAVSRAPGSFDAAWRGVRLLQENAVPFIVKGALLPPNRREIAVFERWAATVPGMKLPPEHAMCFDLRGRRDSSEKNRRIAALRVPPEQCAAMLARGGERYRQQLQLFCSRFAGPAGENLFACGAGLDNPCVDAYGGLQPCLPLRHPECVYDLRHGSLKDAMQVFFPAMRKRKALNLHYLAYCARCGLKGLCEQCPAKSWSEQGTLDTPVAYLCKVAHALAWSQGLLPEGRKGWETGVAGRR